MICNTCGKLFCTCTSATTPLDSGNFTSSVKNRTITEELGKVCVICGQEMCICKQPINNVCPVCHKSQCICADIRDDDLKMASKEYAEHVEDSIEDVKHEFELQEARKQMKKKVACIELQLRDKKRSIFGPSKTMETVYTNIWKQVSNAPDPSKVSFLICGFTDIYGKSEVKTIVNYDELVSISFYYVHTSTKN